MNFIIRSLLQKKTNVHIILYNRKDFYILFGQEDSYTSVFAVLADASQNMMPIFIRQKPPLKNVASKGVVYSKLMWSKLYNV